MSHTELEAIFARFKESFPPTSEYTEGVTLKLTTDELTTMIEDFYPGIDVGDLYSLMTSHGYEYRPIEYNETVTFYWLVGRS
ncbi:MAG: hypothetical protein WCR01_15405 [Bacteroidota bacterium]